MKYSPRRPARRLAPGDLIFFLLFIRVYFAFSPHSQWKGRGNQGSRRTSLPDPLPKLHLAPPRCEIYRNEWALTGDHFFPCAVGPRPCDLPLCKAPRAVPGRSDEAALSPGSPRARARGSTGGQFGSVAVRDTQGSRAPAGLRARRSQHVFPGILQFCDC